MTSPTTASRPTLLVIGARGFLGRFLCRQASVNYRVIRGNRTACNETDISIDITSRGSIDRAFRQTAPDAVVLLAAISDIDRCESDPRYAIAVNRDGAQHVAEACAVAGARLLFTSTGAVFDGLQIGYREDDPVSPLSVYGQTKAEAEQLVLTALPSAIVLRVSLVLGRTGSTATNSLIDNFIRRWAAGDIISAPTYEFRNPIDAATLSRWITELLANPQAQGIYNAGSTDVWSRHQIATALAQGLAIPPAQVREGAVLRQTRAPRGPHQWLIPDKLAGVCSTPPPTSKEAVERSLLGSAS